MHAFDIMVNTNTCLFLGFRLMKEAKAKESQAWEMIAKGAELCGKLVHVYLLVSSLSRLLVHVRIIVTQCESTTCTLFSHFLCRSF